MDGLNEVFSEMKFDPKVSVGNIVTIGVLLFHLVFYSAKGISSSESSVMQVEKNSENIEQIKLENVSHSKDLDYIKKQLEKIDAMVTKLAESG